MTSDELDIRMRLEAFAHIKKLNELYGHLTSKELDPGFIFEGTRIPIHNPQQGIFKPRQMRYLLSIKTVFPKPGGRIWYDDQRNVNQQIFESDEVVEYAFMGTNPDHAHNQWLRIASENQVPVIYFLGVSPGRYQAIFPIFISEWDRYALKAKVVFGSPNQEQVEAFPDSLERRYALHLVKQRLHQASFRDAVILAYEGRCAVSGLPEQRLLDAAHIITDKNERLGQPIVPNGLPLSKIHHAAFDAHLIGLDPDYRLHVSERLLEQHDGPMLEGLKELEGRKLRLPRREMDYPDRNRVAVRFEQFKAAI